MHINALNMFGVSNHTDWVIKVRNIILFRTRTFILFQGNFI